MESEAVFRQALAAAYRLLARRSHSQEELKAKLLKKGFDPTVAGHVLEVVERLGYINDEKTSLQWALSLVEKRCWGRHKVKAYLMHKGIEREVIDRVQQQIWHTFDEADVARAALQKHYSRTGRQPSREQMVRFLQSRGFTQDAIGKNLDADNIDNGKWQR
jgi:regulatory protein